MFTVRPYNDADFDAFTRIDAATRSTAFWGEADWDPIHPPCPESPEARRFVAVHAPTDRVVGYGAVLTSSAQSNLDVMVDPAWQRRGVGRLLWERMRRETDASGAVTFGPWVRVENRAAHAWLEALGFTHVHADGAVQLRVADAVVDDGAHPPIDPEIVLTTLAAEQAVSNPDECLARFVALFREVGADIPHAVPVAAMTEAQVVEELERPGMDRAFVFLAVHRGEYVGLSIVGRRVTDADIRFAGGPNCWSQHLTGVRRAYRRGGIARALKQLAIAAVREQGGDRLLSNSDNPAMRALNAELGFRTGPWRIYSRPGND